MEENESIQYTISKKGKEIARKLLEGLPPSEVGGDPVRAAVILFGFQKSLEEEIKKLEQRVRQTEKTLEIKRDALKKTKDLMEKYYEASRLAGAWGGASERILQTYKRSLGRQAKTKS